MLKGTNWRRRNSFPGYDDGEKGELLTGESSRQLLYKQHEGEKTSPSSGNGKHSGAKRPREKRGFHNIETGLVKFDRPSKTLEKIGTFKEIRYPQSGGSLRKE